ncbi:MAG: DUF2249 domain-containing protein [Bauldia litoralis]
MNVTYKHNTFSASTTVAEAIKGDPAALERLVALSPKFRRLRNPVLRRTMARLATLADAARIAGLPVLAVVAAANGTAVPDGGTEDAPFYRVPSVPAAEPDWFRLVDEAGAVSQDVRPLLDAGQDPLQEIMSASRSVREGGTLIVDAPFDPAPLRRVLCRKGFVSYAREIAPDHFRVYFLLNRDLADRDADAAAGGAGDTPGEAPVWREQGETHIDVRGLEPPQPMLSILQLLDRAEANATVIVHHEREPIFLYPELSERGWQWQRIAAAPHEVRLRLVRTGS